MVKVKREDVMVILTKNDIDNLRENEYKRLSDKRVDLAKYPSDYSMYSKNKKKQQRILNWWVKKANKSVQMDSLWRGRFFIRQFGTTEFEMFEDGSGGVLYVTLRIFDKKTMKYLETYGSVAELCHSRCFRLSWILNSAIVEKFDVWNHNRDSEDYPYNDYVDYNSISNDYIVKNSTQLNPNYNYVFWK